MIHLIKPGTNYDFLGKSRPFVIASTVMALLSIASLFTKGVNYGIDFTGGAEIQVKVPANWDTAKIRETLTSGGIDDASVVQIGDPKDREFLLKIQSSPEGLNQVSAKVEGAFKKNSPEPDSYEIQRADIVGPQAGESLRYSAILSIFYAALGILIYIGFRFDFKYAPGVVRALLVDVIITLGIWVLIGKEFNLTVLAALLTLAGYSCNDTIVIYDRIRDYTTHNPSWSIEQAINRSINQNLGRTFLTVICTLFVVVSIWLLGGPVLSDFGLALLIGMVISIFSTIFVANPMVLYMEKRRMAKMKTAHAR